MSNSDDYFALDSAAGRGYDPLAECHDPHERARLLRDAASLEQQMADLHGQVFGADPNPGENGRDVATSITHSALLLRLLADVEDAAADMDGARLLTGTWLEPYAGAVLDVMAGEPDIAARADLLEDLYAAVVERVGGQGALGPPVPRLRHLLASRVTASRWPRRADRAGGTHPACGGGGPMTPHSELAQEVAP